MENYVGHILPNNEQLQELCPVIRLPAIVDRIWVFPIDNIVAAEIDADNPHSEIKEM